MGGPADPKAGWRTMQKALNADKAYIQFISERSKGPRHADFEPISDDDFEEISVRSWTLMDRYIAYCRRGREPLSLEEFPLLSG